MYRSMVYWFSTESNGENLICILYYHIWIFILRNKTFLISHTDNHLLFILSISIPETGKVVIVLAGRHAGKKAVVVKTFDEGNSEKKFSHCLVAGLARNPRKVTKAMSKSKVEKRSKCMKPFVKYINVRHIFPTRYVVDIDLKKTVDEADLVDAERRVDVKKNLKKVLLDRYLNQKEITSEKKAQGSNYFFQKLRF